MTDSAWTGHRGGPERRGTLEEGPTIERARRQWSVELASAEVIRNGLRTADGRLYVARTDGVSVLDARTGKQRWSYTGGVPRYGLELSAGALFVGEEGGITVLDAESGSVTHRVDADLSAAVEDPESFVVDGGTVYARTTDGLAAIHHPTGSVLWTRETTPQDLVLGDGVLYAVSGDWETTVTAIDAGTGDSRWETEHADPGMAYGSLHGAHAEGVVVGASETDTRVPVTTVDLLDVETGAVRDGTTHMGYWDARRVGEDVFLSETSAVAATRFGADHDEEWETDLPLSAGGNVAALPFAVVGDVLYVSTREGLFALDAETGEILFEYAELGQVDALAATDTELFVGAGDDVHALFPPDTKVFDRSA